MSLVLNTNLNSLVSQNSLTTSGTALATSLQQLSSGLRINTAADDAAGYAIVNGMTSQINGLNQAAKNANDGVSLSQTASGALSEIVSDLQTMRDLAVQSLNATNSASDRTDLDAQFQQLKQDINQVASTTQFNGVNLLDGSFQGATFQVGANAGQTISVASVASAASSNLGKMYTAAGTGTYAVTTAEKNDTGTITLTDVAGKAYTTGTITLTGDQATDQKNIVAAINQATGSSGVVATVNGTGIDVSGTDESDNSVYTVTYTAGNNADTGVAGTETLADLGVDATYDLSATTGTATTAYTDTADVTTVDSSNKVLIQIDAALQELATTGAQLGAYQNRFSAAITGLNTDATNLSSARSQIQDTDYAAATSALTKAQILQQASTAMVAQANTLPQNVLTLIQKLA